MRCSYRTVCPFPVPLLLGLALGGCLTGESKIGLLDDADAASSSTSDDEPMTAGSDGSTTAGEDGTADASTGEAPRSCPPTSQCSVPLDCTLAGSEECGGIIGRSDAEGCPRQPCNTSEDCPAGTSCFSPYSWRRCGYHECADDPETGTCECGFGLDCNDNRLCVPDDEGLPPDTNGTEFCGSRTDALACENSGLPAELGACRWYEGFELPLDAACQERVPVARCTFSAAFFSPGPIPACAGDESRSPLAYVDAGVVTVLFVDPEQPPTELEIEIDDDEYGWYPCEPASVEPGCACACE